MYCVPALNLCLSPAEHLVEDLVEHIPVWRLNEVSLILEEVSKSKNCSLWTWAHLFNLFDLTLEINLLRLVPLGSMNELPSDEEDWSEEDHEVAEDEGRSFPEAWQKHCIPTNNRHDGSPAESIDCNIGLANGLVW